MTKEIFCAKLQQELPALESPPFPNDLGIKIANSISKKAWSMWLGQQTILINEYRLNLIDAKAREFLFEEMNKFLFEQK